MFRPRYAVKESKHECFANAGSGGGCASQVRITQVPLPEPGECEVREKLEGCGDVINAHERDPQIYAQGIAAAVQAATRGGLDLLPLYTHTFQLDELSSALNAMKERPEHFLKALITL